MAKKPTPATVSASDVSTSSSGSDTSSSRGSVAPSEASTGSNDSSATMTEQPPAAAVEKDFESWYLRQLTTEFGDDLDKMRSANDFTDASLPVLIQALKECSATYTEEQKAKIMGRRAAN